MKKVCKILVVLNLFFICIPKGNASLMRNGIDIFCSHQEPAHVISNVDTLSNGVIESIASVTENLKSDTSETQFLQYVKQKMQAFEARLQEQRQKLNIKKINYQIIVENKSGLAAGNSNSGKGFLNSAMLSGGLEIGGIPVSVDYTNNYMQNGSLRFYDNLFKLNFSKTGYQNAAENHLQQLVQLKSTLQLPDVATELKEAILEKVLSNPVLKDETNNQYNKIKQYIEEKRDILELLETNNESLKAKFTELLSDPPAARNTAEVKLRAYANSAEGSKILKNQVDSIVNTISIVRKELKSIGLTVARIRTIENFLGQEGKLDQKDIEELSNFLYTEDLRRFGPVFSKFKDIKAGSFSEQINSSMGSRTALLKGGKFTLDTRRGPVTLGYGRNNELGSAKDGEMTESVYTSPQNLAYMSISTHNTRYASGKISWSSSYSAGQSNPQYSLTSLPRSTVGLSVGQTVKLNRMGKLNFDISKSANIYRNSLESGIEQVFEHKTFFNDYLFDGSYETVAVGVNHEGEIKRWNLKDQFYVNYSGLGFQSPLMTGTSPARFKYGGNIRKSFSKNRINLNLRTDIRNTPVSAFTGDKWKNYQFQFDTRFRINRKAGFNLKYIRNGMLKEIAGTEKSVYSSEKLQADGSLNYKIGNYHTANYLNIGHQVLTNSAESGLSSRFINLHYTGSVMMKKNSLTGTLFYNKELSDYKLIGDMLNADAGIGYQVMDKVTFSSGVNYLFNDGISKQIGVRQTAQLINSKQFDLSVFADLRKNLITPLYPDLYPILKAEVSLKYNFTR